jgi:organic radical activating enzyme
MNVKEVFRTIQGEGFWTGTPAVFVRFAGCNAWSGREEDRGRGAAVCSRWCDTDFRDGTAMTSAEVLAAVKQLDVGMVIFTGGEPGLQLTQELIDTFHIALPGCRLHVETNGSVRLPLGLDWVTVSPKPPLAVTKQHYDEVKVVWPCLDPELYAHLAEHRFVQALDVSGKPFERGAASYVMNHPRWRLSVQTHKYLGLP